MSMFTISCACYIKILIFVHIDLGNILRKYVYIYIYFLYIHTYIYIYSFMHLNSKRIYLHNVSIFNAVLSFLKLLATLGAPKKQTTKKTVLHLDFL